MMVVSVKGIKASEVFDSRDNPTVEVTVELSDGTTGTAKVPSGASTGTREALELRDKDPNYKKGKGVFNAIKNVNEKLAPKLLGMELDADKLSALDNAMIKMDGTENKTKMGANAILGISMAARVAAAKALNMPLYEYLNHEFGLKLPDRQKQKMMLPVPQFNILNGGAHVDTKEKADVQEFMIMPIGAKSFAQALAWGQLVYAT